MDVSIPPSNSSQTPAAARLLDRDLPAGYREAWAARIATEKPASVSQPHAVLVFRVGPEWLALPPLLFREVAENCIVRRIPHRSAGPLLGLVNIRGELQLCVSLASILGIAQAPSPSAATRPIRYRYLLACNPWGSSLTFPVSEVHGIERYHRDELKSLPPLMAGAARSFCVGLLPCKGRSVGCLNSEVLFAELNKGLS